MRKILSNIFVGFAAICLLASCNETMDDKADIDGKYANATVPTVSVTGEVVDFMTYAATATFDNIDVILEEGFILMNAADSTDVQYIKTDSVAANYQKTISGLTAETSYTLQAYAITKSGLTAKSEVVKFTTPEMPQLTIEGTYKATEYSYYEEDYTGEYMMTIAFVGDSETEVEITGFWDTESTVKGTYDEETGVITIESGQPIGEHESYGTIYLYGMSNDGSAYTRTLTLTTKDGLNFQSSIWAARVSAGNFDICDISMQRIME